MPPTTVVVPPTTTTTTVPTGTQCLPLAVTDTLRGLGPLPLLGNLGDLLELDANTCLPVVDLNLCISSVLDAVATPGSLPERVPSVLAACVPLNIPGAVPIAGS